jgi:hypothetical protein
MEYQNPEIQNPENKKKKSGSSLKVLILIILGLVAVAFLLQKDKGALIDRLFTHPSDRSSTYTSPAETKPSISSLFEIKTNKFSTDEYGYFTVVGEVKNISTRPFKFVHVKATYYNAQNNIVGEETTYACGTDFISPGGNKSFKFMGEKPSDYKTVRCEVTDYSEVD